MKTRKKTIGAALIAASALMLAACDANQPNETASQSEQASTPSTPPVVEQAVSKTKPAFAVFTASTGMIHVLLKPKSGPADMVYQNACPAGSQPFGITDINFGGKLFCNDVVNRRVHVMDLSTHAELFSWNWPSDIQGTPAWFIGRWQLNSDAGLAAYDSAKGIFHIFNSADKGFSLSHSFEYGGTGDSILPLVGDWDGDGVDSAGVYRSATKQAFLKNALEAGMADISFGLDQSTFEADAAPVTINLDTRSVIAMYSSDKGLVVFATSDAGSMPFLFGAPAETKVVVPVR
ncbi:MAG TPA: hypothetical protein PK135_02865 [Arenimonas sp.]|nr:hypothetical protein [Arenimonas sp.]